MNRFFSSALLLALVSMTALTGCFESNPVDGGNEANGSTGNGGNGGVAAAGVNNVVVNGDGYSNAVFKSTANRAEIIVGSTFMMINGTYNGRQASVQITLNGSGNGTYQLNTSDIHMLSLTIVNSSYRRYNAVGGTVTITDFGGESGMMRGSYRATVRREDSGAEVVVSGTFSTPR